MSKIAFVALAGRGHEVRLDGRIIGIVYQDGRKWSGRVGEFEIGEHPTRKAAVEAMVDIDSQ